MDKTKDRYLAMEYGPVHHKLCNVHHGMGTPMAKKTHYHDFYQIYFLLRGALTHHTQDGMLRLLAGDCFIVPPFCSHRIEPEEGCEFYSFSFHREFLPAALPEAVEELLALSSMPPKLTPTPEHILTLQQLIAAAEREFQQQDAAFETTLQLLLQTVLVLLRRAYQRKTLPVGENALQGCLDYIHSHFTRPMQLSAVLGQSGLSVSSFYRQFKKLTGQTYQEYVTTLRLRRSCVLLQQADLTVAQIAERCGYRDLSAFYRSFQKHIGCTPSRYRNR